MFSLEEEVVVNVASGCTSILMKRLSSSLLETVHIVVRGGCLPCCCTHVVGRCGIVIVTLGYSCRSMRLLESLCPPSSSGGGGCPCRWILILM